jgi:hypothetical protein
MLQPEKLFGNIFTNKNITPLRLSNFTNDTVTRLTNSNADGKFTDLIAALTAKNNLFSSGLSNIDTTVGVKKGKTQTVNEVQQSFGEYLSEYESEIAHSVGGFKSAAYLAFYPHGVSEYSAASKTQMPLLVKRINTLATANAAQLGEPRTTDMQAFLGEWEAALTDQGSSNSSLSDDRSSRETLRHDLEISLMNAIHFIGLTYPDNVLKCMSLFNFNLLTGITRTATLPVATATV